MTTAPIPVLVLEDDPTVRSVVADIVRATPGLVVGGECADLAQARALLRRAPAGSLGVFDLQLPDGNATTLLDLARARKVDVVVLTHYADDDSVFGALEAGAAGYVLKTDALHEIGESLLTVLQGGAPISPRIARRLMVTFRKPSLPEGPTLTAREWEVLTLFTRGATYGDVACALGTTVNTVRQHVRNLYEKLHVSSKAEAVSLAQSLVRRAGG